MNYDQQARRDYKENVMSDSFLEAVKMMQSALEKGVDVDQVVEYNNQVQQLIKKTAELLRLEQLVHQISHKAYYEGYKFGRQMEGKE